MYRSGHYARRGWDHTARVAFICEGRVSGGVELLDGDVGILVAFS